MMWHRRFRPYPYKGFWLIWIRVFGRLRNQLPSGLRERLTISILPGAPDELPTACYRAGDREFTVQVRTNGLISETALAHLCSMF